METKITISRSFSRKIQVKQFEPADFWASRSLEVPTSTPFEAQKQISQAIYDECKKEVEEAINQYRHEKASQEKKKEVKSPTKQQDHL